MLFIVILACEIILKKKFHLMNVRKRCNNNYGIAINVIYADNNNLIDCHMQYEINDFSINKFIERIESVSTHRNVIMQMSKN